MIARASAFLAAVLLPAVLVKPAAAIALVLQLELYRLLEATGAISAGTTFWGQILGRNIPSHPDWLRGAVVAVSWSVPAASLLWAGLWLRRWSTRDRPRRGGPGLPLRLTGMAVIVGAGIAFTEPRLGMPVQRLCLWLADRAGTNYTILSGAMPLRAGGPFEGHWSGAINLLYLRGPVFGAALASALAAHTLDTAVLLGLSRRLYLGDCPRCGYDRRELLLSEAVPPCPECGSKRRPAAHAPGRQERPARHTRD